MAGTRHYPKAPITEAIIDFKVELPSQVGLPELLRVQAGEEDTYPLVEQRNVAVGQVQFGKEVITTASSTPNGYWFRSADAKQIYQARLDGFTMSRLAPYQRWESFRDEARRLWNKYAAVVQAEKISRVAVRYINRINIPLPLGDFSEYLRTVPEVSSDLPQGLSGYIMHLAIPLEDIKCLCLLNEAIVSPSAPETVSVVLDIDVFRTVELPTDQAELWDLVEVLRERKNLIFEACITDKARELFS